jgi:hypothetical protein
MSRGIFTLAALVGALTLAACDDDPTGPDDDHSDPEGLVIRMGGVTLVTVSGTQITGELAIDVGEESADMSVEFTDADGDPIELDDDEYLEVEILVGSVAEFEQDTPGEFGGRLLGVAVGETGAIFRLMHGAVGSGHPDYISPLIPVNVN